MREIPYEKKTPKRGLLAGLKGLGAAFALAALSIAAGCASGPAVQEALVPQTPLIWPSPPEPARVQYIKTISRPEDIGASKGFFRRVADLLDVEALFPQEVAHELRGAGLAGAVQYLEGTDGGDRSRSGLNRRSRSRSPSPTIILSVLRTARNSRCSSVTL